MITGRNKPDPSSLFSPRIRSRKGVNTQMERDREEEVRSRCVTGPDRGEALPTDRAFLEA